MRNSVCKYFSVPIIQERSTKKFTEIEPPIVFICQDDQYDYNESILNDYSTQTAFTLGRLDGIEKITWKGKYGNVTFGSLQKALFKRNYDKTSVKDIATTEEFVLPFGYCLKLSKAMPRSTIKSVEKSIFLLVDPSKDSRVRITEIPNTRQVFGPTDTDLNMFDLSYFEIIYTMHDRSLYNGESCFSYEEIGSSYGDCIENVMKVELLKVYGCLPPWFVNTKGLTCEEEKDITVDFNLLKSLSEDMYNIAYGTDLDIFNVCKQPCVSISASMTRTSYRSNLLNTSWFGFKGNKINTALLKMINLKIS